MKRACRKFGVLGYQIPLPPLAEQRRVVAQIEQLAAHIHEAQGGGGRGGGAYESIS